MVIVLANTGVLAMEKYPQSAEEVPARPTLERLSNGYLTAL